MASTSLHVRRLLDDLAQRNAEDTRLLHALAIDVLRRTHIEGRRFDARGVVQGDQPPAYYVFARQEAAELLRVAGFQKWYASTWLELDADGCVTADVLTPPADRPTEAFQPVADLCLQRGMAAGWVQQHIVGRRACYRIESDDMPVFFQTARNAYAQVRDWQKLAVRGPVVRRQAPH